MRHSTIPVLLIVLAAGVTFEYGSAHAAGCPPIEAAAIKQATTPYHMLMDRSDAGDRHNEMIQTATTTYALIKGKWVSMPYDAREHLKDMQESAAEQRITCQSIGHDNVDGQPTDHYIAQTKSEKGTTSADVWISSSTGLVVKERAIRSEDGKKTAIDIRFDYANVAAPAESAPLRR
jgi:hypothetical protein